MTPHPSFIFQSAVRVLFFLINLFAIYLMLRGHNLPGGGFIGGLVTAISLVLLRLAFGLPRTFQILRADPVRIAAVGLLTAALTSAAPMLFGQAFLEHYQVHLHHVPLFGDLHVGTPLAFDFGVYLVVIGVTSKIIFVLGKSTQGYSALQPEEEPRYASPLEVPIEEHPTLLLPKGVKEEKEVRRAD
jgi:multisubunit Na+/H+ antiporter MnhB subunit